jgi:hypothetical protein
MRFFLPDPKRKENGPAIGRPTRPSRSQAVPLSVDRTGANFGKGNPDQTCNHGKKVTSNPSHPFFPRHTHHDRKNS